MGIRARLWPGLRTRSIWLDAVIALLGSGSVVLGSADPQGRVLPVPVIITGAVLLTVALLFFRRRAPLVPFAVAGFLAAFSPIGQLGLAIASYAVGRYVARWPVRIAAAVLCAIAYVHPWSPGSGDELAGNIGGVAVVLVLPGVVGVWVRTRALLLTALRERAERAEAERELLAKDAVLTERTRIAREMHDAVGHRVSLMVLQAGAIEMAAGDPERVGTLAEQVQVAGRQALDELRQAVGVLRSGDQDSPEDAAPLAPQPGLDDLERLGQECRTAGMAVELQAPAALAVDPVTSRAAYRIVQEALTNAGKHAPGAQVTVAIVRGEHELAVRVRNGGQAPADDA